jgi:hypothetical protein
MIGHARGITIKCTRVCSLNKTLRNIRNQPSTYIPTGIAIQRNAGLFILASFLENLFEIILNIPT